VRRAKRRDEHVVDELLRAARRELGVERDDDELADAERSDELRLAPRVVQPGAGAARRRAGA
jgi:hypothetical protein